MSVIQGKNLVVKFGTAGAEDKVFCSTNCTLTINHASVDATCKDADSWAGNIPGIRSWEVATDALYDPDATAGGFIDVTDLILDDLNDVTVIFGQEGVGETIWTGKAMVSTVSLSGAIEESATWNATFIGNGELVKGVVAA